MYFKNFQNVLYDFTVRTDKASIIDVVMDLTTRVSAFISPDSFNSLTQQYVVRNGETPDIISGNLYGEPLYHWTIMYINGIADIPSEWPMSDAMLAEYMIRVYGTQVDAPKYPDPQEYAKYQADNTYTMRTGVGQEGVYKLPERIVMDYNYVAAQYGSAWIEYITNATWEIERNEAKRVIKVIQPQFIEDFVSQFMSQITV